MHATFHRQQLVALALHQFGDRNAGGTRDNFGDLFGADFGAQQLEFQLALAASACFIRASSAGSLPY
jgi:hypothetical protein